MLRLIVHADDFGLSKSVNLGIIKSFNEGILTSASIMVNGDGFEDSVDLLKLNPSLDLGLHLTLVGEKPVLPLHYVRSLLNGEDKFHNNSIVFLKKYFGGSINLGQIEKECEAQIKKALDFNLHISHLDSHQHIHILPGIFNIVYGLTKKYNIKYIRLPGEKLKLYMIKEKNKWRRMVSMKSLHFLSYFAGKHVREKIDCFTGFFFDGNLNRKNFLTILNSLPVDGTCEIMCHPGLDKPKDLSNGSYHSELETDALVDPEVKELVAAKKISLISFSDLNKQ
jgi:predicted glycoside hydrolase/deacetylase ChbG (UPF0249 family)